MLVTWLAAAAMVAWLAIVLLPSRPWSTRERLAAASEPLAAADADRVTVLIPARNEAEAIAVTLGALAEQARGLRVIVIDDESSDATAATARQFNDSLTAPLRLTVTAGAPLPAGWGGKLWALHQGQEQVESEYCLLLDAEISLAPGVIAALVDKAERERRALVSVMARLRCVDFWERLLVPPFIYFFKLLYPFARVNSPRRRTAAAAGGCILIRTDVLHEIGGFDAIRDALIDDCTLAAKFKRAGHGIWLGLSDSVTSARAYTELASFRHMVTRTAFTQLHYSIVLLALVVALMLLVFVVPFAALLAGPTLLARVAGAIAVVAMLFSYLPTVRFYRLPWWWAVTLPIAGVLFLAMTIESAVRYWRGIRAEWKGRRYATR